MALCFLKSWGFDLRSASHISSPSSSLASQTLASSLSCPEGPEEPAPLLPAPGPPLGVSDLETALMD